jgi:hypothetical protein
MTRTPRVGNAGMDAASCTGTKASLAIVVAHDTQESQYSMKSRPWHHWRSSSSGNDCAATSSEGKSPCSPLLRFRLQNERV